MRVTIAFASALAGSGKSQEDEAPLFGFGERDWVTVLRSRVAMFESVAHH
jgi:hypothetical protein